MECHSRVLNFRWVKFIYNLLWPGLKILREPQHTPDIPKPPNERNSFINCWLGVWGLLQGSVGKFLERYISSLKMVDFLAIAMLVYWEGTSPTSLRLDRSPSMIQVLNSTKIPKDVFPKNGWKDMGGTPKIGGFYPQNGWWTFHGKPYWNGWFGGPTPIFGKYPCKHPRRLTASLSQWLNGLNFLGSHV